jgi:hypothetical protein
MSEEEHCEYSICLEIEERMGICCLGNEPHNRETVLNSYRLLSDREWLCGAYFVLSILGGKDQELQKIVDKISSIKPQDLNRNTLIVGIAKELMNKM